LELRKRGEVIGSCFGSERILAKVVVHSNAVNLAATSRERISRSA
jgi:hypothetical protein